MSVLDVIQAPTAVQPLAASGEGGEFVAPGPGSFELPPWAEVAGFGLTKSMLLIVLSAVIIIGFTYAASRKSAVVPGRLQFAGEAVYGFVRNTLARDNIGSEHFMKFVPYLFSLFLFILVNNYYGIIPFLQFPTFSRIGYIVPLALIAWFTYIGVGMWKHGVLGYFKHATMPGGVKGPILILLVPLEFFSNILVRPVTLTLRLFGNMFAGHLLLILFATGGAALLSSGNLLYGAVGILSFGLGIGVSFLEALVMFLQAYVFTLLTSMYIGEALADEH
ncbi:F0F1 ATP synthase subunit A [Nocardioides aequoreus]|uniref:F0F1 ATP synthase subunit A n=1 Tax=Nocardioides aequoreus TaxID=397278 RepID=UPI000A8EE1D4|nr:F0F1 ATP synthase subunit A [Nocardioides aequoreus]